MNHHPSLYLSPILRTIRLSDYLGTLRRVAVPVAVLLLILPQGACTKNAPKTSEQQVAGAQLPPRDNRARQVAGKKRVLRIVSLGGGVSETVAALGRGEDIVGTDSTTLFPETLKSLPKVGYFRSFSPEGVVSLKPDLVLASDGVGPQGAVSKLREAGISFIELKDVKTLDDVLSRTLEIGRAIDELEKAKALVDSLGSEFKKLRSEHKNLPSQRLRCLFIYARGAGMMLVGGKNTSADAVMKLAGLRNAAASISEFGSLSAEGMLTFQPDVILIPKRGLQSIGGIEGLLSVPGVAATPAGQAKRVIAMEDSRLLAMGPRTAEVARDLMVAAYPELYGK